MLGEGGVSLEHSMIDEVESIGLMKECQVWMNGFEWWWGVCVYKKRYLMAGQREDTEEVCRKTPLD